MELNKNETYPHNLLLTSSDFPTKSVKVLTTGNIGVPFAITRD